MTHNSCPFSNYDYVRFCAKTFFKNIINQKIGEAVFLQGQNKMAKKCLNFFGNLKYLPGTLFQSFFFDF